MNPKVRTTRALLLLLPAVLVWAGASGCGPRERVAGPVDAKAGRDSLRTVLESWKRSESPDQFRQANPSITAQDLDWRAGYKLLDYEIVGEGTVDNSVLRCPVKLKLRDPQGRELTRQVTYMIGTDPSITVFREMSF